MALPLRLLWKVCIPDSEKKGLSGVFSVGILIMIFTITRAIQIAFTSTSDSVLLALLSHSIYISLSALSSALSQTY